jgi:hypothetical protein
MDLIATNKNDILDPLSVMVKLFIYNYKPIGTKISIGNNRVYIQDTNVIQGIIRKFNGDSKNDINILYCPIVYACSHHKKQYSKLFDIALKGLDNLKSTYANTPIIYNIEAIITLISSQTKEQKEKEHKEKEQKEKEHKEKKESVVDSAMNKIKENIYQHLNEVWTQQRLNILQGYIHELTENQNPQIKNLLLEGLMRFMDCIDTYVANILLNIK